MNLLQRLPLAQLYTIFRHLLLPFLALVSVFALGIILAVSDTTPLHIVPLFVFSGVFSFSVTVIYETYRPRRFDTPAPALPLPESSESLATIIPDDDKLRNYVHQDPWRDWPPRLSGLELVRHFRGSERYPQSVAARRESGWDRQIREAVEGRWGGVGLPQNETERIKRNMQRVTRRIRGETMLREVVMGEGTGRESWWEGIRGGFAGWRETFGY